MRRPPAASGSIVTVAPKCPSMRSVWSRVACGSMTVVSPGVLRPASKHRRFDLRRRHRQPINRRHRAEGAGHRQRQAAAVPAVKQRAKARQRVDHTPHRAAAQRGIAGHEAGERVRRKNAEQQPCRGAGIAEIEYIVRFGEAADANPVDQPASIRRVARPPRPSRASPRRSPARPRLRAGPVISVRPTASAPNISARCEIDLSPGTVTVPASGAAGREAASGAGAGSEWSSGIGSASDCGGFDKAARHLVVAAMPAHMRAPAAAVSRRQMVAGNCFAGNCFDRPRRLWQWRAAIRDNRAPPLYPEPDRSRLWQNPNGAPSTSARAAARAITI